FSLRRNPPRRGERGPRPNDQLIGLVEPALRRAPGRGIYGARPPLIVERRKGFGFLEGRAVVVVDPEVERVVPHHPEHEPVAEHAGLAEHAPHGDADRAARADRARTRQSGRWRPSSILGESKFANTITSSLPERF